MTRPAPYPHQIVDTQTLLGRPAYALFCGVGSGKTRTVVDAACALFTAGTIDTVLVVCPAPARSVWADPSPVLGEFAKWATVPYTTAEFHQGTDVQALRPRDLFVLVTNPEYLRYGAEMRPKRGYTLSARSSDLGAWLRARKVLLVVDESWMYQNPHASQGKTLWRLRRECDRVTLLNGTPGRMEHLYTQFTILDRDIFRRPIELNGVTCPGVTNWWGYRDHYLIMGGYRNKQVVGYRNVEEFQARTRGYAVYRDTTGPGGVPLETQIEVPLSPKTWRIYRDIRDELVHWFSSDEAAVVQQAAVKTMRLAQITSGFLGGVQSLGDTPAPPSLKAIGDEKVLGLLRWLRTGWDGGKLVVFTWYRPDVERTVEGLRLVYPSHRVLPFYGGQGEEDRTEAKTLLAPGGDPGPAILVANTQSGQAALNFAAADICVFLANSWSLKTRQQAMGRMRPLLLPDRRVTYLDVLATGPNGERTIDHVMLEALRADEDVARWTAETWKEKLCGEEKHVGASGRAPARGVPRRR